MRQRTVWHYSTNYLNTYILFETFITMHPCPQKPHKIPSDEQSLETQIKTVIQLAF